MNPGKADVHFVPDFTLFCTEKTIYMKVTRKLYTTAIRTTEIEKQRTSSINKSLSGVAIGDSADNDSKTHPETHSHLPRERKTSQYLMDANKFRKISMSTNLPDSSLFHEPSSLSSSKNNIAMEDDKLVVSYQDKPPMKPPNKDNLKHSKSVPSDALKRSDAVDLLSEVASDKSSPDEHIRMISLPNESRDSDSGETNPKAGNGSLINASKMVNADQKSSDVDEHDETSKLI